MRRGKLLYSLMLLAPGILLLLMFFVLPLWQMGSISFYDRYPMVKHLGVGKYLELLTDSYTWMVVWNSVKLALTVTFGTAVLGYPVAYYFVRGKSKYKHLVFLGIISPLLVSIVVRTLGWMLVLGSQGLINKILIATGLRETPESFLGNFPSIVLGMIHVLLPFMILSIASVLRDINPALEEAAQILGARPVETFLRVTLPLSLQGVLAGAALVFCLSIGAYVTPHFLGGGKVPLLSTAIFDQALQIVDWPMASAMSMVLAVLALTGSLGYVVLLERLGRR